MKVSKNTNNLYSAEINKWIRAHYNPGARTGQVQKVSYGCSITGRGGVMSQRFRRRTCDL